MKLTLSLAIVASLLSVSTAAASPAADKHALQMQMPDWSKTPVVAHDLGHGVHWLESFGGNIGVVVGPNGILLVDAKYPELNAKVRADLAQISPLPVRYVVNTHWHWDHVGADADWTRTGAVVIASEETWKHITDTEALPGAPKTGPYHPDPASLPVITVGQGARLHLGGNTVEIMHIAPAHTDGDLVVRYPEADVIQTGDTFFGHFYPDIDVVHGGSIDGMIAWLGRLYAMCGPNTKIIPGHGPIQTRADVLAYQAMLKEVRRRVAKAIAAGMSEDQLVDAHPLDDLDKTWGGNLIQQPVVLAFVYRDLKAKRH